MRLAALAMIAVSAAPAAAQTPVYESARGGGGIELRRFTFEPGIQLKAASQTAVPVFAGRPFGRRLFVDLTASYAMTRLEAYDGEKLALSGLTDTQLRASYTLARDAVIISFGVNLPSGVSQIDSTELAVIRSAAQNFLPFPVSNYGTGLGATAGGVLVRRLGEWSLGLGASVRYISSYEPFLNTESSYSPGLEGRLRFGFQRLLGERASLAGGFTYTTFGTDEFSGVSQFEYQAGNRYIGELALTRQLGRARLRLVGWAYDRSAGDSSGVVNERSRERILHGSALYERPVSPRVSVDGGLEGRSWQAQNPTRGWVIGLRGGLRYRLSSVMTVSIASRLETGRIRLELGEAGLRGLGLSLSLVVGN